MHTAPAPRAHAATKERGDDSSVCALPVCGGNKTEKKKRSQVAKGLALYKVKVLRSKGAAGDGEEKKPANILLYREYSAKTRTNNLALRAVL